MKCESFSAKFAQENHKILFLHVYFSPNSARFLCFQQKASFFLSHAQITILFVDLVFLQQFIRKNARQEKSAVFSRVFCEFFYFSQIVVKNKDRSLRGIDFYRIIKILPKEIFEDLF